jgi:hypothetical protein
MLTTIFDSFNFCSSNNCQVKQELKIEEAKQYNEKIQSPKINLEFSNLKLPKLKKQNIIISPSDNNPNLSFCKKKTEISENENCLLCSNKNSFSNEEIENNYKLILSDFEGDLLEGKILKINAAGLKYSLRNQKDGISFFGINNMNETNKNDFILNLQKIIFNKNKIIGTIFAIYFQKNENKYFLQSFINNSNEQIYYKIPIEIGYKIKNKDRFQIGKNFFTVEIGENNNDIRIIIEDLDNQNNSLSYIFKKPNKNKPILLGRSSKCNIHISSNLLSKIHCNIIYDYDNNNFIMKDGFINKFSTNGTWLVVNDKIDIINNKYEDYIKIGKKILKIEKKV